MQVLRKIKNPETLVWLGLGLWWMVNLIQAGCTELANDEAYYYMFAQKLDWGYFDHPPMVALLVWLGGFLGNELGVRFFFTLLQPLYLYLLWRIIRPEHPSLREAGLYVLIASAMPILQLYGFIAVPDGPLMFFTALFLYCYKRFSEKDSVANALWMGLCLGALAYSKYHGALVLLFVLLSNLRLLRNPRFYLCCLFAAILVVPHIWWQYTHDWVSFRYHLTGRNRDFEINYLTEYLLNLWAIFNPFLFPVFVVAWWKSRSQTAVMRALSCVSAGFILFFLGSTLRGYVQPQWEIPATFGIIAILWNYTREHDRLRRYVVRVSWFTLLLVGLLRIEMLFNPLGLKIEVFDNHTSYQQLATVAGGRPVIFDGRYAIAAKYNFYTGEESYARPRVDFRSSQYQFNQADSLMAGESVVMEVAPETPNAKCLQMANGRSFYYQILTPFYSTRQVQITHTPLPSQVKCGDTLRIGMTVVNPYPYTFALDGDSTAVNIVWRRLGEKTRVLPLKKITGKLEAHGSLHFQAACPVPDSLRRGNVYEVGFMLTNTPYWWWFNSKSQQIRISSSKSKQK